jgi:poly(3-hydroxyalkanoate) synthetase
MYAFSKWHMRDIENRNRVYNIWMNMKLLSPDLKRINQNMRQNNFKMTAYFGEQDHVIRKESIKKLRRTIPTAKVVIINKGHNLLDEHLFVDIAQHLTC